MNLSSHQDDSLVSNQPGEEEGLVDLVEEVAKVAEGVLAVEVKEAVMVVHEEEQKEVRVVESMAAMLAEMKGHS